MTRRRSVPAAPWARRLGFVIAISFLGAGTALASTPQVPDWVAQAAANAATFKEGATAAILLQDTLLSVQPDGRVTERYREVIKILRPQGRKHAELEAWYTKDSKLKSFHAWSIGPDGHQYVVKDDQVKDFGFEGGGMLYVDERAKAVTPPGADPGGVVAYECERQVTSYGSDEATWDFQGHLPRQHAIFEIDLPEGWKDNVSWRQHVPVNPVEVTPNHFRWQLDDVPGIDLTGVKMAPSVGALSGRMVVHYAATAPPTGDKLWAQMGNWYTNLAAPRTDGPGEIGSKSREVVAGSQDTMAKLRGVADFMQREIRYVGIEIGIGGLQPHSAADVYKNRYGDCKDKATLMISMLNAVGIKATWVLVDTHRGYVDPTLPSIRGNHAITAIEIPAGYSNPGLHAMVTAKSGKHYLIFDPTNPYIPIGFLPDYLQGSYGILADAGDSQVIELPTLNPDADLVERAATFQLKENGTLSGKVRETRSGDSAVPFRILFNEEGEKKQHEAVEEELQQDLSNFSLTDISAEHSREMDKSLIVNYSVQSTNYAKVAGNLLLVRPRVLGRTGNAIEEKRRIYPIDMRQTGTWRDKFDVTLPAGYVVDDVPEPVSVDVGFATYSSSVKASDGVLHYSREYVVRSLDVAPEKSADVRKLMGAIASDEQNSAVLKKQ